MQPEDRDSIEWKARIFKDKVLIPQIEEELRVLVQVILGDKRKLEIECWDEVTYGDGSKRLFDTYTYCNCSSKKYCPAKDKKYKGYISDLGYAFYADNKIGIYCEVIKRFAGDRVIIPFSY